MINHKISDVLPQPDVSQWLEYQAYHKKILNGPLNDSLFKTKFTPLFNPAKCLTGEKLEFKLYEPIVLFTVPGYGAVAPYPGDAVSLTIKYKAWESGVRTRYYRGTCVEYHDDTMTIRNKKQTLTIRQDWPYECTPSLKDMQVSTWDNPGSMFAIFVSILKRD